MNGSRGDVVRIRDLWRTYESPDGDVTPLKGVSMSVGSGELLAIMGPSGSGKTTLVNLIAGLDAPTQGTIEVLGSDLRELTEAARTSFRAAHVGLVFQDPHLLPGLTALENVMAPRLPWEGGRSLEVRARDMLDAVGLSSRVRFPPRRLSGGERQRVGIARALVGRPELLLADEPTGNLDQRTTRQVVELLGQLRPLFSLTLVVATHDPAIHAIADRRLVLDDGAVSEVRD